MIASIVKLPRVDEVHEILGEFELAQLEGSIG